MELYIFIAANIPKTKTHNVELLKCGVYLQTRQFLENVLNIINNSRPVKKI